MADGDNSDTSLEDNSEAAMTLAVKSRDVLEMTVTKTCLDVFTKLGAVSILAVLQLWQSLIDRIVAWAFCHPRSNLSCNKSGFCKLPEYWLLIGLNYVTRGSRHTRELRHFLKNKLGLGRQTCNIYRFCCKKSITARYFLKHIFATCKNLICCKCRQVWFVGGKTRNIAIQLV